MPQSTAGLPRGEKRAYLRGMKHTPAHLLRTDGLLSRCRLARLNALADGRMFPRIPFAKPSAVSADTGVLRFAK